MQQDNVIIYGRLKKKLVFLDGGRKIKFQGFIDRYYYLF
jgi:hypothetical protein